MSPSLQDGNERRSRRDEENAAVIKAEAEAIARGEECELGRMFAEKMALEAKEKVAQESSIQEPAYKMQVVEEEGQPSKVVIAVTLPLVTSAGAIDAEIVQGSRFELEVEGIYKLSANLPAAINEEEMSCRFDKKKKVLTVKIPILG